MADPVQGLPTLEDLGINVDDVLLGASIIGIFVGILLVFFGCRIFKMSLALMGFTLGFLLGFFIVQLFAPEDVTTKVIVGGVLGLILGSVAVFLYKAGLFVAGAICGCSAILLFNAIAPSVLQPLWVSVVAMIIAGAMFGLLALYVAKTPVSIVTSSALGSLFVGLGADHFAEGQLAPTRLLAGQGCSDAVCYVVFSAMIFLAVVGCVIQWKYVRKRDDDDADDAPAAAPRRRSQTRRSSDRPGSRTVNRKSSNFLDMPSV